VPGAARESSVTAFGGLLAGGAAGLEAVNDSGAVILIFCIVVLAVITWGIVFGRH
jgi:hypothetical protein